MVQTIAYIPNSHLDLYWLGSYQTCLERGNEILKSYLDRCVEHEETFLIETVIFLENFLHTYPEYKETIIKLFNTQKIDIGAAYIDRWESLIQGESLIRNIVIGKRKLKTLLGLDSTLAAHPDLPSVASQIGQIYCKTNIKYYVTTRKIYPMGGVWSQQSPDGSSILFLNLPLHYIFFGLDPNSDQHFNTWMGDHAQCKISNLFKGFPAGTALLPGGAGDLTTREDFIERYDNMSLQDYIVKYRKIFPEYTFTYATVSQILSEYDDGKYEVPIHQGEIPSVWGVACDETIEFFQNDRLWERLLLIAEQLSSLAQVTQREWLPSDFKTWQGKFYECAFYKPDDKFETQEEIFAKLWEMIIFTQDHNGGGYEGALSTFQKRVIQERGIDYTKKIIKEVLSLKNEEIVIYNPSNHFYTGYVIINKRWKDNILPVLYPKNIQIQEDDDRIYIELDSLAPFSNRYLLADTNAPATETSDLETVYVGSEKCWLLAQGRHRIYISCQTGNVHSWPELLSHSSNNSIGALKIENESHSDVTLRRNLDSSVIQEEFIGISAYEAGPVFKRITIRKILLQCIVEQSYTLFKSTEELEINCKIHWVGAHYKQVSMKLADYNNREKISYGTPFFANSYEDCINNTGPRNPDELLVEDFQAYREIQGWVGLQQNLTWLTILSNNPGIYAQNGRLNAVLIRTAPSCGDHRFFWENAGIQEFSFRYFMVKQESDEQNKQHSMILAHRFLHFTPIAVCGSERPYSAHTIESVSVGIKNRSPSQSEFIDQLRITSPNQAVMVSALYPGIELDTFVLRILNASFTNNTADIQGNLVKGKQLFSCNLLEQQINLEKNLVKLKPWEIKTLLIR